jgi:hypothetical protein
VPNPPLLNRVAGLEDPGARDPDDLLLTSVVMSALNSLSEEHLAVLVECHYREHSVAEAARRLDIPERAVKSRIHEALWAVRRSLEDAGCVERSQPPSVRNGLPNGSGASVTGASGHPWPERLPGGARTALRRLRSR